MKTIRIALVVVMLAVLGGALVLTQSGQDLFQQALVKEQADGDLRGAIAIYQRIVRDFSADRTLAAKALVQMGRCYEKLGAAELTEARRAYERLVREYGEQAGLVAEARARLAALSTPTAFTARGTTLGVRQVWASTGDIPLAPTRDGRHLFFWEKSENLAVRDLGTGQTRRLTNKPPGSLEFFAASAEPSPDGTQVVYSWYNANDFVDLRIVGFDGSDARVLFADPALKGEVYPVAWSPDGGTILATHYAKDGATRILTVSVLDGSVRFLNVKGRKPSRLRFSPDGRYIAYDFGESGTLDIAVLTADGTRETPVVQHSGNDVLFDWTPDGKRLLFGSDRSGTMGAWWIQVADGQPAGTPELIKPDLGHVRPVGFTRDGSFYYRVSTALSDVYISEIDVGTGRVLAPPIPASDRYVGFNERPAWSPDGRELLFLSARGPGIYGAKAICIRSTEKGEVREIASGLKSIVGIHWFPDGRSLLTAARGAGGGRPTVFRVDVGSGAFAAVDLTTPAPIGMTQGPAWSVDGKTLFYPRWGPAKTSLIVARDLATGQERELHSVTAPSVYTSGLRISPDGRRLAVVVRDKDGRSQSLTVVPAAGGEAREVLRSAQLGSPSSIAWAPDGQGLLFVKQSDTRDTKTELWLAPLQGNQLRPLGLAADGMRDLCVHPDGRHIAYTRGVNRSEIWAMENFLPAATPTSQATASGVKK